MKIETRGAKLNRLMNTLLPYITSTDIKFLFYCKAKYPEKYGAALWGVKG